MAWEGKQMRRKTKKEGMRKSEEEDRNEERRESNALSGEKRLNIKRLI